MNSSAALGILAITSALGANAMSAEDPTLTRTQLVAECVQEAAQTHWAGNNSRQHQQKMIAICNEWTGSISGSEGNLLARCLAEAGRGTFNWKRQRMWNISHIKRQRLLCNLLSQSAL